LKGSIDWRIHKLHILFRRDYAGIIICNVTLVKIEICNTCINKQHRLLKMDFRQIKTFITVAQTGNITRAAQLLHLVQPAVSRQIKLLEQDLGTALFERQRHGMQLTDAGKRLLAYAQRSLLELERARAELTSEDREVGGLVTLGLLPSTTDTLAASLVKTVRARFPKIRLRIAMGYAGTLQQWLESGEIDAALLYGAEQFPNIKTTALIEEPLWVIGPGSARLSPKRPMPLRTLAKHEVVLPSKPHAIRLLVDHACAVSKLHLNITAETNALSVQRALVLGDLGLTLLPPIAVAEDLRSKKLSGTPVVEPSIVRTIVLGTPTNRPVSKAAQCCVEVLTECAKAAVQRRDWPQGRWLDN
jgi:LysR family transcriptional regulator, nitrogen assimilation regulatory protein